LEWIEKWAWWVVKQMLLPWKKSNFMAKMHVEALESSSQKYQKLLP